MSDLLFVYGTLRKGNANEMAEYLAEHAQFITEGWFQGRMFYITYYPGVVTSETGSDCVYGEVYRLDNPETMLNVLDDYEECTERHIQPAEYKRTYVSITAINGKVYDTVWIYLYQWSVKDKSQIMTGDFMQARTHAY